MADIVGQLRQAVLDSDLMLIELSGQSGVSRSVLSRFSRGERTITLETAAKIATALNLGLAPLGKRRKKR